MKRKSRHIPWCITSFDETPPEWDPEVYRFMSYQRESCPTTNKLHWQIYVCFNEARTFNTVQKLFPNTHIEQRLGTHAKAFEYTRKFETSVANTHKMFGNPPDSQGERTDLDTAFDSFLEGGWNCVSNSMIVKYHRGLQFLKTVRKKIKRRSGT